MKIEPHCAMAVPLFMKFPRNNLQLLSPILSFGISSGLSSSSHNKDHYHDYCTSAADTFKASDLQVTLCKSPLSKPEVGDGGYGTTFTNHMLIVEWEQRSGWTPPRIQPMQPLLIHPAAKVLQYAIQVFEGMKAFRGVDGQVRLFRPELNVERLLRGAQRSLLPSFQPQQFLHCLKTLLKIDERCMPQSDASSVYIRPVLMGTDPAIRVGPSNTAMLYVVLCPVLGTYFETSKTVSLFATSKYVRAWPRGVGDMKLAANYGPTVYVQKAAVEAGCEQVLWLYGDDQQLTEVGQMNIFLLIDHKNGEKELVTPPLQGLVLPGITRQSILELAREWKEFKVSERPITMKEFIRLHGEKRILEVFGVGTAASVCPVGAINFEGVVYAIPTVEQQSPTYQRFLKGLSDIHYGRINHPWSYLVD